MDGFSNPRGPTAPTRHGMQHDFLLLQHELLFFLDIATGIFLGYISGALYLHLVQGAAGLGDVTGAMWRETILGSVIAALTVRERMSASERIIPDKNRVFGALLQRGAAAAFVLLSVGLLTRAVGDMARLWILAWAALFAGWLGASRLVLLAFCRRAASRGQLREAVAVVGAQDIAAHLSERLSLDADIVALVDDGDEFDDDGPCQSAIEEVLDLARSGAIDTVILALDRRGADVGPLVRHLKAVPVQVTICADPDGLGPKTQIRMLGGVPLTIVADRPLQYWDLLLKAVLDKVGAGLLLFFALPLFVAIAIAVAYESPGPVIFRQTRSGCGGLPFTLFKFRTMRHVPDRPLCRQTERNDPRCTRVGAFLRRTSLDELPQLWNVMRGEMSLVGPRPHAEALHAEERASSAVIADYAQRQRVKPGLTGWAQVHGLRGAAHTVEQLRKRIEYDLYYIDHWSIWLDLKILARTPVIVLSAENAF